jgi:putative transposase
MHDWESQAHVKWNCKYHLVFVPKYRRKANNGSLRQKNRNFLSAIENAG